MQKGLAKLKSEGQFFESDNLSTNFAASHSRAENQTIDKMKDIIQFSNRIAKLDSEAAKDFSQTLITETFQKGDYILKANEVCKHFYFIEQGLTKSFFYNDEKEFIMTFFKENMMFTEISSYLTQRPSKYMILVLEPTVVRSIHQSQIESLCAKHHCIETMFRKIFSMSSIGMMARISEMLEENATARYQNFLTNNGELLQRISLGDLAKYLGITQVSLSRIRAGK